jgi:uncharacterized protein (DUF1501 family)
MTQSRRDFLVRTTCAAMSAAAAQASLQKLGLMNLYARPSAPNDYRAMVCIFLDGGNDSNNMVVPTDAYYSGQYALARPANSGIQIPNVGLPGGLVSVGAPASLGGRTFGFHPSLAELAALYGQNKLGVVSNVGPLVEPVTQANIDSKQTPYSLFSHSDQIDCWQTGRADQRIATGWGGRAADVTINCNAGSGFPTVTTISGASTFCVGAGQRPLAIDTGALDQVLVLNGFYGSPQDVARKNAMDYARTIDRTASLIAAASDTTQQAVDISAALSVDPTLATVFPSTYLGDQLLQVAKVMKLNLTSPELSLNRQIFYVEQGGYDTHQDQFTDQAAQLADLSQAMNAFYAATLELGVVDLGLRPHARALGGPGLGRHRPRLGQPPVRHGRRGGGRQLLRQPGRQRPDLPGADHRRRGRHLAGRPRPLDPDDLRRAVRRDARALVRRLGARPARGLSQHGQLPGGTARIPHARLELLSG